MRILVLGLLTVAAIAVFAWTAVHALVYAPEDLPNTSLPEKPVVAKSGSEPQRLQIPALGIDANVQYVGLNGRGEMGIPNNYTDVAWYKDGAVPGRLGSAVIDGHVDNGLSLPGVFKHLSDIKLGDDVYVLQNDGSRLHFQVTGVTSYFYKDAPTSIIFSQKDKSRLNLITCDGAWVSGERTYDHRTVVFTELQAM